MKQKGFCGSSFKASRPVRNGFSLIEMALTVALLAAAFWLSAPSLRQLSVESELGQDSVSADIIQSISDVYDVNGVDSLQACEEGTFEACDMDSSARKEHEYDRLFPSQEESEQP